MYLIGGILAADPSCHDVGMLTEWYRRRYEGELLTEKTVIGDLFYSTPGGPVSVARHDGILALVIGRLHGPYPDPRTASRVRSGTSPAEIILDGYLSKGRRLRPEVGGQYVAVVADNEVGRVSAAADPVGMRTFYWGQIDDSIAFATNLKSLTRALPAVELDREIEDFLLTYGFPPSDRTVYRDLRQAAPGRVLEVERDGAVELATTTLAPVHAPHADPGETTTDSIVAGLYGQYLEALRDLLPSEERVGVLLGGFDSALVAAGLVALGKRVETFSFGYADTSYNQPLTDEVSRFLGATHHWVPIDVELIRRGLREFGDVYNRPTLWPNYVIQTRAAVEVMAKEGIRTCFSGDGCDTLFLGYPGTFRRTRLVSRLPQLPVPVAEALLKLLRRPSLERAIGHPYRVLLTLIKSMGLREPLKSYVSFRVLDQVSLRQLRRLPPEHSMAIEDLLEEMAEPLRDLDPYRRAYLGKSLVSPNKIKMIGAADATGIPILSPYLHPDLIAFARRVPLELIRPNKAIDAGIGKLVLQMMALQYQMLPASVVRQPKVAAVDAPVDDWYSGPLRKDMERQILSIPFQPDPSYVNRLLDVTPAERWFRDRVLVDRVISHAASLLSTYGSFVPR